VGVFGAPIVQAALPFHEHHLRMVAAIVMHDDQHGDAMVRSTVLTSQLPVARWHEQIGDPTLADGILDRLVHNAHRIEMRGDSMRKNRAKA